MRTLELRIPPLVLVAAAALGMWLLDRAAPSLRFDFKSQNLVAVVLACLGVWVCAAGVLAFRRADTTTNPMKPAATSSLVSRGIYRVSRNPMYLGFVVLLLGWGTFIGNPLAVAVVAMFVGYLTRFQIIPEERALRGMFEDEYDSYCRDVRRWI